MNLTKEFLIHEYLVLKKSSNLIAKELDIKKYHITNALKKYDIQCRSLRESRKPKLSKGLENHKWCNSCKQDLPYDSFSSNSRDRLNLDCYCKPCTAKKQKKYSPFRNLARIRIKAELIVEFGNQCNHCGASNLPVAMFTFHHHSEKMSEDSYKRVTAVLSSKNINTINSEKLKWILLCSNCHNLHHSTCKQTATEIMALY